MNSLKPCLTSNKWVIGKCWEGAQNQRDWSGSPVDCVKRRLEGLGSSFPSMAFCASAGLKPRHWQISVSFSWKLWFCLLWFSPHLCSSVCTDTLPHFPSNCVTHITTTSNFTPPSTFSVHHIHFFFSLACFIFLLAFLEIPWMYLISEDFEIQCGPLTQEAEEPAWAMNPGWGQSPLKSLLTTLLFFC